MSVRLSEFDVQLSQLTGMCKTLVQLKPLISDGG